MNLTNYNTLYEFNRQKIEKDQAFIVKEKILKSDPDFGALLNRLGNWMIAKGEQLHGQYGVSRQNTTLVILQDKSSIFKA